MSQDDEKEIQQLIKKLSEMHSDHPTSPLTLYMALTVNFNFRYSDYKSLYKMQLRLFKLCKKRGDSWAQEKKEK